MHCKNSQKPSDNQTNDSKRNNSSLENTHVPKTNNRNKFQTEYQFRFSNNDVKLIQNFTNLPETQNNRQPLLPISNLNNYYRYKSSSSHFHRTNIIHDRKRKMNEESKSSINKYKYRKNQNDKSVDKLEDVSNLKRSNEEKKNLPEIEKHQKMEVIDEAAQDLLNLGKNLESDLVKFKFKIENENSFTSSAPSYGGYSENEESKDTNNNEFLCPNKNTELDSKRNENLCKNMIVKLSGLMHEVNSGLEYFEIQLDVLYCKLCSEVIVNEKDLNQHIFSIGHICKN